MNKVVKKWMIYSLLVLTFVVPALMFWFLGWKVGLLSFIVGGFGWLQWIVFVFFDFMYKPIEELDKSLGVKTDYSFYKYVLIIGLVILVLGFFGWWYS